MHGRNYALVIGGANIDILGMPAGRLVNNDSNPGKVTTSPGGVSRNIAENLVILGLSTKLISAVGDDEYGKRIIEEGRHAGLDVDHVAIIEGAATSTYLSVLDDKGDMYIALSDMDIVKNIDAPMLESNAELINNAAVVVFDTNLEQAAIDFLLTEFPDAIFFADTVSTAKTVKLKNSLSSLFCLKPNRKEAEILTDMLIEKESDFYEAVNLLLEKGLKQVFITAGEKGVYYGRRNKTGHFKMEPGRIENANGAGDMFTAAAVYCFLDNKSIDYSARFAVCASVMSMKSIRTINRDLNAEVIKNELDSFMNSKDS